MAGGKETPRQKMIGMMYLVLTALLALNISKDILDAFIQINHGLGITNSVLEDKATSTLTSLRNPKPEDAEKAKPFAAKAEEVNKWAGDMMDYIEEMKARVYAAALRGNKDGTGFEAYMENGKAILPDAKKDGKLIITKPDENQNNTTLLVGADPKNPRTDPFSANDLRTRLSKFRDDLSGLTITRNDGTDAPPFELKEDVKSAIQKTFAFEDGVDKDDKPAKWETHNFYHMPLVAVIANLSKIQTDVMNVKNNVLNSIAEGINLDDMKFTDVTVAVVPLQSYVIKGNEYSVEVFLAAYNKSSTTKVYMGSMYNGDTPPTPQIFTPSGEGILSNEEGKCVFKVNTNNMSLGPHGYSGQIAFMKGGKEEFIPFVTQPFFVGEPALVVSPTNMNVFYRGLDNPVEISVPGVDKSAIKVSMTGGSISGPASDGTYNVKPSESREALIKVVAKINGKDTPMPDKRFRIKRIPDPVPILGTKKPSDQTISLSDVGILLGLKAEMENFDFPVKADIISYNVVITIGGKYNEYQVKGKQLSPEAKTALAKLKRNDKFMVEAIMCKMPDGTERRLSPISLKIS